MIVKGVWVPDLQEKQWEIFNTRKRIVLVCGSRLSGKTWAVCHRVVRHLWETPGARVAVFAKTKTSAEDGGTWQDLVERTIPEWIQANIGMVYISTDRSGAPGPRNSSSTRTASFTVSNCHTERLGASHPWGSSECSLFSISNDDDVSSLVKNKSFSMVYFIELSNFKTQDVLTYTQSCLRLAHLKPKNRGEKDTYSQWIADTNPDEDLGDESWFYKHFYIERNQLQPDTPNGKIMRDYFDDVHVIERFIEDNTRATEQEINTLKALCMNQPHLWHSHVDGKHGKGTRGSRFHFNELFSEAIHVIGAEDDEDDDQIEIGEQTSELLTGWDTGQVWHAAGIVDKWHHLLPNTIDENGKTIPGKRILCFSVLDEVGSFDEKIPIGAFADIVFEKMRDLEERYGRSFEWKHYLDDSALNLFVPSSNSTDCAEIMARSDGFMDEGNTIGVRKPVGSVEARVNLLRNLLRQNRIFVSKRCVNLREMFKKLQKGTSKSAFVTWNQHKHSFDWLSYILYMECFEEVVFSNRRVPHAAKVPQPVAV